MWRLNSRPWRYQHHALPTELTNHMFLRLQNSPYSSTREQSNKRSGMRLKTEREQSNKRSGMRLQETRRACEARAFRARKTLTPRFTDFFTDFEKKTDCFAVYMFLWKDVPFSMIWTLHNGHSRLRVPDPEASRCTREKPLVTTKL